MKKIVKLRLTNTGRKGLIDRGMKQRKLKRIKTALAGSSK